MKLGIRFCGEDYAGYSEKIIKCVILQERNGRKCTKLGENCNANSASQSSVKVVTLIIESKGMSVKFLLSLFLL